MLSSFLTIWIKKKRIFERSHRLFSFSFLFFAFLGWFDLSEVPDLISAPLPPPFFDMPPEKNREKEIARLEKKKHLTAQKQLELGRYCIECRKWDEGEKWLLSAASSLLDASIQLGFLYLWNDRLEEAADLFLQTLCNPSSLEGVKRTARKIGKTNREKALFLYDQAIRCSPYFSDLYTLSGILLSQIGKWEEAKERLQKALELSPKDIDAALQLASIMRWQKDFQGAQKIYEKYEENEEAKRALAKIHHYQLEHQKAKELILQVEPMTTVEWKERMDLYQHTDPALSFLSKATFAKEDDPNLKKPTVKDDYLLTQLAVSLPLNDRWKIDVKPFYFLQKEKNIVDPSTNYQGNELGMRLSSDWIFHPYWQAAFFTNLFYAWGAQKEVTFPFHETFRFEPGAHLFYTEEPHFAVFDLHMESIVTKNYARQLAEVLWFSSLNLFYQYRLDHWLEPKASISFQESYYQDENWRNFEGFRFESNFFTPWLKIFAETNHSHFDFLSDFYFSYRQQVWQSAGLSFESCLDSFWKWNLLWEHSWQWTYHLIMPIGTFLYVAQKQYIVGNLFSLDLSYRYFDRFKVGIEGHYLRTSLVYEDFGLKLDFLWQF